jgi:hypothetical protein
MANVQFKTASGGAFKTLKRVALTDPYGYFDTRVTFPSSGLVRITWTYPRGTPGGQIQSRTVPVTIH